MVRRRPVTQDALAELYSEGRRAKDPVSVAHKIEQLARAPGRLAADVPPATALTMAAELCHQHGAIAEALRLVETALAWRSPGDDRPSAPALRAVLLVRSGRRDDGLAILDGLRSDMAVSFEAATVVPEALEQINETALAVEWLTAAVHDLSPRALGADSDPIDAQLMAVLLATRSRLRGSLGLEPDHLDVLAPSATNDEHALADLGEGSVSGQRLGRIALLYWPRVEFEAFARMWPDLAAGYGNGSWAGHRSQVEKMLQSYTEGGVRLTVVSADLEGFLHYTAEQGLDAKTADARSAYAAELGRRRKGVAYPPVGRNAPCWCGSGRRFRRCCGNAETSLAAGWARLFG